jgi:hydroxyethylthiazole kinase
MGQRAFAVETVNDVSHTFQHDSPFLITELGYGSVTMTENLACDPTRGLETIRREAPVVHNITNFVVMNTTANALLAMGASPVMAHAEEEMADMVAIASALVINIGTLSPAWVASMRVAISSAKSKNIPIVLDPVGAGATRYRTETARELLALARPSILRGNASEILALAALGTGGQTKGVDSRDPSSAAIASAKVLSETFGSVVSISGETDYIVEANRLALVRNGHSMMPRVTGLGCTASALSGAFAAVERDPWVAATQAMVTMGIAGEIAAEKASGPGTLQLHFLDALYGLTGDVIAKRMRAEVRNVTA